jgi:predicted dehydrogenase
MKRSRSSRSSSTSSRRRSAASRGPVRYAVVGLGHIAQVAVLPAFRHAGNSKLVALVSSDRKKLTQLGRRYRVTRLHDYDEYDELLASGDIDAVYIALPNTMHRDYTERAARAGIHVLCEKPIAVTSRDSEAMIRACARADVRLMIAYRLHFEKATLEAMRIAQSGQLGDLRFFSSQFSLQVKDPENIRLKAELGGGPLHDIGINAARMVFGCEPVRVFASETESDDPRFEEVPETVSAILDFGEGRTASFVCSFGSSDTSAYQVVGTRGSLHVDPAYEYAEGLQFEVRRDGKRKVHKFSKSDQFAPELLHFSDCVLRGRDPAASGEVGLADICVIEAIQRSAATACGRPVASTANVPQPDMRNERRRPAVRKPDLVSVAAH